MTLEPLSSQSHKHNINTLTHKCNLPTISHCVTQASTNDLLRDVKFVFFKFELQPLEFRLNSNFVYIFVEKLKQFAFDVCSVSGPPRFVTLIAFISI